MSQFNTNKWFKNQYLKEAGLKEGLQADNIYDAYFEAVVKQIEDSRFDDPELIQFLKRYKNYIEMDVKSWEMSQSLNEAPGSTLNLSQADMDKLHKDGKLEIDGHKLLFKVEESLNEVESTDIEKLDFAFVDGTTKLYAVYVYKKGGRGAQWDKKLSRKEAQELLNANDIDIEINPYNIDKIDDALKDIKVTQSEFDVS